MMNPTLVHMGNPSTIEDGITTENGYLLSSNGWAAFEPRAAYENRVAMMMTPQDVQGYSLQTNAFAHWPSTTVITEQYHVPFTPNQSYPDPTTHEFSYSGRDVHFSQARNSGTHHEEPHYDYFWMGIHSDSPPSGSDAGSDSPRALPEQPPIMNGTPPESSIPRSWQRRSRTYGSEGDFYVCKGADGAPSAQFKGATAAPTFTNPFSLDGVCTVPAGTQSPASTPPQYHPSPSQSPSSISHGRAHQDHTLRCKPLPVSPVLPSRRGVPCPTERSEQRTTQSRKTSPCNVATLPAEKTHRTLRSVRTRFGDVYAEHEQGTDQSGGVGSSGRWVCQCGSTFVRDSDWERHAMHSLSHSAGGGFDCSLCDISFTRSDAMFRHRRKKHGIRNAPCRGSRDSEDEASQPLPARGRLVTRRLSSSRAKSAKY